METEKVKAKVKKKIWWQEKIKDLEAELELIHASEQSGEFTRGYAEGFCDCMRKHGMTSKSRIGRLREQMLLKGPGAAKAGKRTRFALTVPSV